MGYGIVLESLERRLTAFERGDPGPLMEPDAVAECFEVLDTCTPEDFRACAIVGSVLWHRCVRDPGGEGIEQLARAMALLSIAVDHDPGSVPSLFLKMGLDEGSVRVNDVIGRLAAIGNGLLAEPDLEAKVAGMDRLALAHSLLPDDHPDKAARARVISANSRLLYDRTGRSHLLDKAIEVGRAALPLARDRDVQLALAYNLSNDLRVRFRASAQQADLDASQDLCAQLIRAVSDEDPRSGDYMSSYARTLLERTDVRRSGPEQERLIRVARKAVELTDPGHDYYLHRLEVLAGALGGAHAVVDEASRLDEAIDLFRRVRREAAEGAAVYTTATSNLAAALVARFHRDADTSLLHEAMALSQEAVGLMGPLDLQRWATVKTQSEILDALSEDDADHPYLDQSAALARQVIELVAENPLKRMHATNSLAWILYRRWWRDKSREADLRDAIELWETIGREREVAPQARAEILTRAARRTRSAKGAASAMPLFLGLIDSIRLQMWEESDQPTQLDFLSQNAFSVAADGAACAAELGDAAGAVQILESGRALLWNRSPDLREELDRIPEAAADLKAALQARLEVADMPAREPGLVVTGWPQHPEEQAFARSRLKNRAGSAITGLIHRVRALPPSPSLPDPRAFHFLPGRDDLTLASGDGPVVYVNFSMERCDALIVHNGDVIPYAFPFSIEEFIATVHDVGTSENDLEDRFGRDLTLGILLDWLWENGFADMMTLLRERGCISGSRTRLWWCPTGAFGGLPLHAVGRSGGGESVIDHVVSSYTSSLKSLRRLRTPSSTPAKAKDILAVTLRETPGCPVCYSWPILETAERERRFLIDVYGEDRITDVNGPAATRARILDELQGHRRFHFCGHGNQTRIASRGGMIPYDWESRKRQVSVADVARQGNLGGDLAFLGACYASSPPLGEEPLTLSQAFHHFGWRHVVAPLMSVYEDSAATLMEEFYRNLIANGDDPNASAVSLHDTMLTLRRQRPASPTHWALFTHFGV